MAKFRLAGSKKPKLRSDARAALPCLILIVLGILVVCVLFYFSLQSGNP
ncbi:MAG TPA: hypothetical protein VKG25_01920 [Bryobacteraceae bacterium]|nr:hypothetical protein [Bryobacteraceae bacterium]